MLNITSVINLKREKNIKHNSTKAIFKMNSNIDDNNSSSTMCIACTKAAAILPGISGGISALSSSLIILIIFRSSDKISTIYHRIMLGLSIADIFSSVALGLTTLPLPKELPFEHPPYYGIRLGNSQTCTAQGFFLSFGFSAGLSYHVSLFLYNTCTIVFRMQEKNIGKYVEPFLLHLLPIATGLWSSISPLKYNLYNPNKRNPGCLVTLDEQNSNIEAFKILATSFVMSSLAKITVRIICSIMIVRRVFSVEKALSRPRMFARTSRMIPGLNVVKRSLQNTKVVLVHSFAFLLAFLLTFGTTVTRFIVDVESPFLAKLSFILVPSQGFFNFFIFISHKVYNYRRVHTDLSRLEVVKMLLHGCEQEPVLFSRISIVQMFDERGIDVEVSDERDNIEHFHIRIEENSLPPHSSAHLQVDNESERDDDISGFSFPTEQRSNNGKISQSSNDGRESKIFSQSNPATGVTELSSSIPAPDCSLDKREEISSIDGNTV